MVVVVLLLPFTMSIVLVWHLVLSTMCMCVLGRDNNPGIVGTFISSLLSIYLASS